MASDIQLTSSLDARSFLALLNGLSKQMFSEDATITDDFLASELFPVADLDSAEILSEISTARSLLRRCAAENWDVAKVTENLRSSSVSPEIGKVFIAFWEREHQNIHSKVLSSCRWNRHYKALAWRVDLRSASMRDADVNEPIALFEFASQRGLKSSSSDPEKKVARFQMNRKQVGDMLTTLEGIKKKIEDANVSI